MARFDLLWPNDSYETLATTKNAFKNVCIIRAQIELIGFLGLINRIFREILSANDLTIR